jgi:hypothetical protein
MDLIAYRPPPGVWRGLDTVQHLTPDYGRAIYGLGYRWVGRYLRRDGVVLDGPRAGGEYGAAVADGCDSLSLRELRDILGAQLAVLPVQYGSFGSASDGQQLGAAAVQSARLLGLAQGTHLWADLEGGAPELAGHAAVRAYVEAWAAAVTAGGYLAGLYSTHVGLTSGQLYGLAGITSYWSAAGPPPHNPLPRGFAVEQDLPHDVLGRDADSDTLRQDRAGEAPALVATPEIAQALEAEALGLQLARQYAQAT